MGGGDDQDRDEEAPEKRDASSSSVESWLAARLGEIDEEPMDSDELSFTEAEKVWDEAPTFPDLGPPEKAEAPAEDDEPSVPELDWDPDLSPTPTPVSDRDAPPPARGLGNEDASGDRPDETQEAPRWGDGDTQPLPPAPDPWASRASQGTDFSPPPRRRGSDTRPSELPDDPELDELLQMDSERPRPREDSEASLPDPDLIARLESRMPGRSFDEVFPHPPRRGRQREDTQAFLDKESEGGEQTATAIMHDLLEVDDEAAPNNIHTEPTHVNVPPAGFAGYDPALDEPTVISRPKRGQPRPPRAAEPTPAPAPSADEDEPLPASVLAWTASTFGVLLFGALVIVAALALAQYYDLLDLEVLDLDLLPGRPMR